MTFYTKSNRFVLVVPALPIVLAQELRTTFSLEHFIINSQEKDFTIKMTFNSSTQYIKIMLAHIVYDSLLLPTKLWFRLCLSSNVEVQTFISPKYLRLGKLLLHQPPNIAQTHLERNFVF